MLQNDLVGVLRATLGDEAVVRPVGQAIAELDRVLAGLPAPPDPATAGRDAQLATVLRDARDELNKVRSGRGSAAAVLANLELLSRRGHELRADLGRDVAEQRAALGALYAELAGDAVKAGDPTRARRLLATAAHVDPGNRTRYEKQLQSFAPAASLPRETADPGAAGQETAR